MIQETGNADIVETERDVALAAGEGADRDEVVKTKIPASLLARYEIHSHRSAAVILTENFPEEFSKLLAALENFY